MAALLDLHPDTADAASAGVADLHAVIDRMHTSPLGSSRPSADVAEVDRAIRRLESYKLKLVVAADAAGVAKDAGFTGADAWLAKTTTVSRADAARQVALASELGSGHDATAEALDAGLVSPDHAAVIVRATGELPAGVSEEQRQTVEASLVEKAARFSPDQLRRLARRAIEAVEPDQKIVDAHENELIRREEHAAREKCSLSLHDNGDGTTTGHFTIPALAAAMLGKVIDAMTAPRRMREPGQPQHGPVLRLAAPPRPRVRRAPRAPAHRPPAPQDRRHRGGHHRPHRPHRRDEGRPPRHRRALSAGEARRLACTAGILPAVLGTKSVALDLGRESRLFSEIQRVAKGLEHATCAADRLRTPLRLVRAPPPTTLGQRRPHRPRRRHPALLPAPPLDPRQRLQPPDPPRRHHPIQQTHVSIFVATMRARGAGCVARSRPASASEWTDETEHRTCRGGWKCSTTTLS